MLENPIITAFIPTINPEKAKHFYMNILGLSLVSEDAYALEFEGKGSSLRITLVEKFEPFPFTVLGFRIENIDLHVKSLIDNDVAFERYASLDQDSLGVWTAPSKAKIAWFKDLDGNLLSLTELSC